MVNRVGCRISDESVTKWFLSIPNKTATDDDEATKERVEWSRGLVVVAPLVVAMIVTLYMEMELAVTSKCHK